MVLNSAFEPNGSKRNHRQKYIRSLASLTMDDLALVGGKNASLGELINSLSPLGVRVSGGFAITADAYSQILKTGGLKAKLSALFSDFDKNDLDDLSARANAARSMIREVGLPDDVRKEILSAYADLESIYGPQPDVAVRSSGTAEDLPEASFAGQQETFLNVRGETALLQACLYCFASLFTERAVSYRIDKGFDHTSVRLSVGVQKMVRSDLASSGVIFTLDPESGFRNVVLVTSAWGLGENVVGGRIDPDEFLVFKPTLGKCSLPIIKRRIGAKQQRLIYSGHGTRTTRNVPVVSEDQERPSLDDEAILKLAEWGCLIEEHYSKLRGKPTPMDIEWALDGRDGELYIVQARPETIHSGNTKNRIESWTLVEKGPVLLTGRSIGEKIGSGKVKVIRGLHELQKFEDKDVLVTDMTDPDWEPVMKRASAIVTNRGGRTCHAAIVSRELGVPCVVGTEQATEVLRAGDPVTVCCAEGATGFVYGGILSRERRIIELSNVPDTRTEIMVNVGNPDHAFSVAGLPVAGVGLAREEFIVVNEVGIHPMALCHFDDLPACPTKDKIEQITRNYPIPSDFYVDRLSEGIGMIAAAFYPRPVIVRLADFKTNEYANLLGGEFFEPQEENPMIGFRGASRYLSEAYRGALAIECEALLRARRDMGLNNIILMVPFCRTPAEGMHVLSLLAEHGLVQHEDGLEVYVMCEVPSNVLLIDEFAEIFDGLSIGSNDLTQLILGVDRDSSILADVFDERDPAVMRAIAMAVEGARRSGKKIGICGQAPSDHPEIVSFLVGLGIDSISLNEDVVLKTLLMVSEAENQQRASCKRSGHISDPAKGSFSVDSGADKVAKRRIFMLP